MTKEYIARTVASLQEQFCTRSPLDIAEGLDIVVQYRPLGELDGMYLYIEGISFIVINEKSDESTADATLAHELGHHCLHEQLVKTAGIREIICYDVSQGPEYEANLFAAILLIERDEFEELVREGRTLGEIAGILSIPESLINLFFRVMYK